MEISIKNKKIKLGIIIFGIFFLCGLTYLGYGLFSLKYIEVSNIEGNVPSQAEFDTYLSRDLQSYFSKEMGEQVSVSYDLLRSEPTQSGVSYPKFYAWVHIVSVKSEKIINQGAVRLAAVDKSSFSVTDFVSTKDIQAHPDSLSLVFPSDVVKKIEELSSKVKNDEPGTAKSGA